jgi:hypothetical protein
MPGLFDMTSGRRLGLVGIAGPDRIHDGGHLGDRRFATVRRSDGHRPQLIDANIQPLHDLPGDALAGRIEKLLIKRCRCPHYLDRLARCPSLEQPFKGTADGEVVAASEYRALQNQVRELQRLLGKKTMEAEILKDALEVAAGSKKQMLRSLSWPKDGSR